MKTLMIVFATMLLASGCTSYYNRPYNRGYSYNRPRDNDRRVYRDRDGDRHEREERYEHRNQPYNSSRPYGY